MNLSNGDGTFGSEIHSVTQNQGNYMSWQTSTMADVNGDGFEDAVFIGQLTTGTRVAVNLSNGDGSFGSEIHKRHADSGRLYRLANKHHGRRQRRRGCRCCFYSAYD